MIYELTLTGNMVDMSHSPTPNGYHRASPCSSPGVMAPKGMARQSPPIHGRPPPNLPGPPRLMVPDGRNNMINSEVLDITWFLKLFAHLTNNNWVQNFVRGVSGACHHPLNNERQWSVTAQ